jgi:hypothetical protein
MSVSQQESNHKEAKKSVSMTSLHDGITLTFPESLRKVPSQEEAHRLAKQLTRVNSRINTNSDAGCRRNLMDEFEFPFSPRYCPSPTPVEEAHRQAKKQLPPMPLTPHLHSIQMQMALRNESFSFDDIPALKCSVAPLCMIAVTCMQVSQKHLHREAKLCRPSAFSVVGNNIERARKLIF